MQHPQIRQSAFYQRPGGAYSAPQTTYLDLRDPTSKEREGKERWREWEKRGRGGEDVCSRNFQLF